MHVFKKKKMIFPLHFGLPRISITLAIKGKTCGFYSFLRAGHLLSTLFYIHMINIIDKIIVYLIILAGKTF